MAVYLFDMRDFLDARFQKYVDIDLKRTQQFVNQERTAQQIHLDVIRSLWRYHFFIELSLGKGKDNHIIMQRVMQCIFERLVFDIWASLDSVVQKAYYQSVTDILEIIFGAYINFNQIFRLAPEIQQKSKVTNDSYDYYNGDMQIYFNHNYDKVVKVGIQVIYQLYDQTKFDVNNILQTCHELYEYIGKYDKKLYKILQNSGEQDIIEASFVPFVFNCGLHFASDLSLSSLLAKALLGYKQHGQMKILQRLISGCAQLCYPQIFKGRLSEERIAYKYEEQHMTEIDGIEVLNHGIVKILGDSDYAALLIEHLNFEIKNKYIERYKIPEIEEQLALKASSAETMNSSRSTIELTNSVIFRK